MNDNNGSNNRQIKKKILFYGLQIQPMLHPYTQEKQLLEQLPKLLFERFSLFVNSNFTRNKLSVKILSCDVNHVFGCIHKITEFSNILADIKFKGNNEELNPDEIFLDYHTYFYMNFENQKMCCINSQYISNPTSILEDLLSHDSPINISIIPLTKKIRDIKATEFFLNITLLDPDKDFVALGDLASLNCEIVQAETKIKFKESPSKIDKAISKIKHAVSPSIKSMYISTDDEMFDVVKETFTRSAYIEINREYRENQSQLEETLKSELFKALNT